eukprot:15336889-Ditylum_brightwellii.AAC.1
MESSVNIALSNPCYMDFGMLKDNIVQTYQLRGIKFHYFEQGIQENKAKSIKQLVIEKVKSYQSKLSGICLHYEQGITLKNVLIANVRAGLDVVYTDDITLEAVCQSGEKNITGT